MSKMENPFGVEAIRLELKRLSVFVYEEGIHASFQPNDCPFIDFFKKTCECIQHGGEVDRIALTSLLHHIAENLCSKI